MSPRMGLDMQTVLNAAAEIADQDGFDAVTMALVAQKLNVRSPSLYNHIEGLGGLRKSLAVYGIKAFYAWLLEAAGGEAGETSAYKFAEAYLSFVHHHPGLYQATLKPSEWSDTEARQISNDIINLALQALKGYNLDEESSIHAVRGLRSMLHGFASLKKDGGFGLPIDLKDSLRFNIDTFLAGLRVREGRSE
jgi:AcrR family transcriptional regulator